MHVSVLRIQLAYTVTEFSRCTSTIPDTEATLVLVFSIRIVHDHYEIYENEVKNRKIFALSI